MSQQVSSSSRRSRATLIGTALGCSAAAVIALGLCTVAVRKFRPHPDQIAIADPVAAVAKAHALIEEKRREPPESSSAYVGPDDVPSELRIKPLRYMYVHEDHVDLVFFRTPNVNEGLRIWSPDATRRHADRPTRYPGIYHFVHHDNFPEKPDNIF